MPVRRAPADLTHLRASVANGMTEPSLAAFPWFSLRRGSFRKGATASELANDVFHVTPAALRNELVPRDDQRDMTAHMTFWEHVFAEKRRSSLGDSTFRLSIAPQALRRTWNRIQLHTASAHARGIAGREPGIVACKR